MHSNCSVCQIRGGSRELDRIAALVRGDTRLYRLTHTHSPYRSRYTGAGWAEWVFELQDYTDEGIVRILRSNLTRRRADLLDAGVSLAHRSMPTWNDCNAVAAGGNV